MISIKLATGHLKLFPDTSVELIKNNPIMAEDGKIPGTYTITIEVPNDEAGYNASLLGAVNMVENYEAVINSEQTATLFFDGVPLEYGKIIVKPGADISRFNLDFVGGLRAISRDFKDKKITEMSWPTVTLHSVDFGTGDTGAVAEAADLNTAITTAIGNVITARNAGHFSLNRFLNPGFSDAPLFADYVNQVKTSDQSPLANGIYIKKQFKYLTGVSISPNGGLETVAGNIALSVNGTTYTSTVVSTSLMEKYKELATMVNAAEGTTGITLTAIVDKSNFYVNLSGNVAQNGENGHLQIEVINAVDDDVDLTEFTTIEADGNWGETENTVETSFTNQYHYAPCFSISSVLAKIEEDYGVTFIGDFIDDAALQTLTFHTNTSLMQPVSVGDLDIDGECVAFKPSFNAADYLPDWTIGEFIRHIAFTFGCTLMYDQYTQLITFRYLSPIVQSATYYDATAEGIKFSKGLPDSSAYSGITLKYPDAPTQFPLFDQVIVGTGEKEMGLPFALLSSRFNQDDDMKKTPVLFFNSGVISGQYSASVSTGTAADDYSLVIGGYFDNELYITFHKPWVRFLTTRKTLPVTALMELRHINQFDFTQKIMIDRVKYLVASMKIKLTMKGIKPTELTLYSTL
tara:strand:- start:16791 stop:18686 length:1896 start_codon:yes stop_codon:yes gene_type:complete